MIGAYVCSKCFIIFSYRYNPIGGDWTCANCGKHPDKNDFNIIGFGVLASELISCRTDFIKKQPKHVRIFKIHENMPYSVLRSFMIGNRDPNEIYRDWLEEHIGKQGINWDWNITSDLDVVQINFMEHEHAVLFELKWPTQ